MFPMEREFERDLLAKHARNKGSLIFASKILLAHFDVMLSTCVKVK